MFLTRSLICLATFCSFFSTSPLQSSSGVHGNAADYVIVGVGTAGAVLAKRLTDDKKTSVIALHSGQNFTDSFILKYSKNVPFSVFASLFAAPAFNPDELDLPSDIRQQLKDLLELSSGSQNSLYEGGVTTPQVNANGRELLWVIPLPGAGGSAVNAGAWCRGTNQLFAQWETIAGLHWSVSRVLKIYKELEKYHGESANPGFRGTDGPIKVLQDSDPSTLSKVFAKAVIQATGVPFVVDYNDPKTPIGVSTQLQLTHRGHDGFYRVSSITAFLNHHIMRSNGKGVNGRKLRVLFNSAALRTIWDGNTAVGVEFVQNGVNKRVYAKKGVIVCAGLRSSTFLMHSGVGSSVILNSLGIPVIFDNPNVGQQLADQPHVVIAFTSNPNDSVAGSNKVFSQISWLPAPGGDPIKREVRFATIDVVPGITLGLLDLCQPKSRGTISINSTDPLDPPLIDLGILSNSDDLTLFVSAFQTYIKNINIQLQAIDPKYRLIFPDPAIIDDVIALTDFIKEEVGSNMHFQSHCRMAPLAQGGVVDSKGRVYGVKNLYVADNSIVPQCMDGSPMASAYLIAANIARLLGH